MNPETQKLINELQNEILMQNNIIFLQKQLIKLLESKL